MDNRLTAMQIAALAVAGMCHALLGSVKVPLTSKLQIDESRVGGPVSVFGFTIIPMLFLYGRLVDFVGKQTYEAWWRIQPQFHWFRPLASRAKQELGKLRKRISRRDLYRARRELPPLSRGIIASPAKVAWPQKGRDRICVGPVHITNIRVKDDGVYAGLGNLLK